MNVAVCCSLRACPQGVGGKFVTRPGARDMSRAMEPLFLIVGCLIVGYPREALWVVGAYLFLSLVRYVLRLIW